MRDDIKHIEELLIEAFLSRRKWKKPIEEHDLLRKVRKDQRDKCKTAIDNLVRKRVLNPFRCKNYVAYRIDKEQLK